MSNIMAKSKYCAAVSLDESIVDDLIKLKWTRHVHYNVIDRLTMIMVEDANEWLNVRGVRTGNAANSIPLPQANLSEIVQPTALYRHYGSCGELLYIGISLSVINRTMQHSRSGWWDSVAKIEIDRYPSRESAVDAEKSAIISENPIHNIIHKRW